MQFTSFSLVYFLSLSFFFLFVFSFGFLPSSLSLSILLFSFLFSPLFFLFPFHSLVSPLPSSDNNKDTTAYVNSPVCGPLARDIINRAVCLNAIGNEVFVQLMRQVKKNNDEAARDRCSLLYLLFTFLLFLDGSSSSFPSNTIAPAADADFAGTTTAATATATASATNSVTNVSTTGGGGGGGGAGSTGASEYRNDDTVLYA
jgi:hypothetical protein